jgi:hypothetical protein
MRMASLAVFALVSVACHEAPALVRQGKKVALTGELSRTFSKSVEAEKSAVLATTDEESERFAAESKSAAQEVNRLLGELSALITEDARPREKERLDAFSAAWGKVAAIDARLLPLAVANTNLKAAHLSTHQGAMALERLLAAVNAMEEGSKDPKRIRELARAQMAALTIQTLHAPHIASPDDAEMTALEARIHALEGTVEGAIASAGDRVPQAKDARAAWEEYRDNTAEILRLSRENTNVLSFSISVHEKREASVAAEVALQSLVNEVQNDGPRPTR